MHIHQRGRPPVSPHDDQKFLIEANSHVREKRCRSRTDAFRWVASSVGNEDERQQHTFIERLRRLHLKQSEESKEN